MKLIIQYASILMLPFSLLAVILLIIRGLIPDALSQEERVGAWIAFWIITFNAILQTITILL